MDVAVGDGVGLGVAVGVGVSVAVGVDVCVGVGLAVGLGLSSDADVGEGEGSTAVGFGLTDGVLLAAGEATGGRGAIVTSPGKTVHATVSTISPQSPIHCPIAHQRMSSLYPIGRR